MLTAGDDYPLHQTPEPIAFAGSNRNFYDRYFFNGYSEDGALFFAAALGVYPQLNIMDAAFCVSVDGRQHNLRASKYMGSDRLDLSVGPISLEIVAPLNQLRLKISDNDSPLSADITFTSRHAPIEEPRFIRRQDSRVLMDYTRLTQNGIWAGDIAVDGQQIPVTGLFGTRDRSWGIRPVGAAESQPPAGGELPQFWWLWAPLNFDSHAIFFHSNDDGAGVPWNRRGVIAPLDGADQHFDADSFDLSYHPGGRKIKQITVPLPNDGALSITPREEKFYMSGLGYLHPEWGHGMGHGALEVGYDTVTLEPEPPTDMTTLHIQALSDAVLTLDGQRHQGVGVTEQMFIGPHESSGLTGLLDPAS